MTNVDRLANLCKYAHVINAQQERTRQDFLICDNQEAGVKKNNLNLCVASHLYSTSSAQTNAFICEEGILACKHRKIPSYLYTHP